MKNFEMKDRVEGMQLMKGTQMSWRVVIQYTLVATLIIIGMMSQTKTCLASGTGYAISLTPHIDPATGNFKVSIDGYRGLNAHVVNTPSQSPASGVSVTFYTTRGTLSTTPGTTNSNGDVGTTLWGGWGAGLATVRATVTKNNADYSDEAIIPVVKPDGETTVFDDWVDTRGFWRMQLTPTDVNFSAIHVTERSGGTVGAGDTCYYQNNPWNYIEQKTVSDAGTSFGPVSSTNWYGDDAVGWKPTPVANYRSVGRAPCSAHLKQYMDVQRPGEEAANDINYTTNVLGFGIQTTPIPGTVSSQRDGKSQFENWQ